MGEYLQVGMIYERTGTRCSNLVLKCCQHKVS